MGLEYKRNLIGVDSSVSLASVRGLDDYHPTMSMPSGHGGQSKIREKKNTESLNFRSLLIIP